MLAGSWVIVGIINRPTTLINGFIWRCSIQDVKYGPGQSSVRVLRITEFDERDDVVCELVDAIVVCSGGQFTRDQVPWH